MANAVASSGVENREIESGTNIMRSTSGYGGESDAERLPPAPACRREKKNLLQGRSLALHLIALASGTILPENLTMHTAAGQVGLQLAISRAAM